MNEKCSLCNVVAVAVGQVGQRGRVLLLDFGFDFATLHLASRSPEALLCCCRLEEGGEGLKEASLRPHHQFSVEPHKVKSGSLPPELTVYKSSAEI